MSERLNNMEHMEEGTQANNSWDSLSDVPFNSGEKQELSRSELEKQTIDKLGQNHSAKKAIQKIILGVVMAATLIGGAIGISGSIEKNADSRPMNISEVVSAADTFVDKDSDDLVWFETITDDTGLSVEYNQHFRNQDHSYDNALQGDIAQVEMSWWEGRGPMYKAIDQNADGEWDLVQKLDVYTEDLSTMDLNDLDGLNAKSLTMSSMEQLFR